MTLLVFTIRGYFPKYRWGENYTASNEHPYGLKLFYDLLKSKYKNDFILINRPPKNQLANKDTSSTYIFIGDKFILDSASSSQLYSFVQRGNNAIISCKESTHDLFLEFTKNQHPNITYKYHYNIKIDLAFDSVHGSSKFRFDFKQYKQAVTYRWAGLDSLYFTDTLAYFGYEKVSSFNNYYIDCFRFKVGKGWIVFHFNPVLFSNYTLSGKNGYNYAKSLLSPYLEKKIYWDEYSKAPEDLDYSNSAHETPLRFILSQKSLRWAWYLIGILALLFIIFNSKRKQAFIPLMPSNKNTTLEYINSVSALHYQNGSLAYLSDEILKQFMYFIKHRYDISSNMDKSLIAKKLAPKSGIREEIIHKLFKHYMGVRYSPVKETNDLIEFYKLTEYFYKNCK